MKIADMTGQDLSERLLIAVINYDESADRLLNFPHLRKGSFAVLTQLCVGDKNLSGHYSTCLTVTNDMLNGWGISKNELFQMASENSVKQFPAVLQPITDFVKGSESVFLEEAFDISRIRVLSTETYFNGAAAMFYPGMLERIAESLQCEKYYIMPSSVNHMYCIPEGNGITLDELKGVFKELSKLIEDKSRLCNDILVYDTNKNKLQEMDGTTFDTLLNVPNMVQNKSR